MPDSFRRPSQAELISVPSYPTPTQSTFSTLDQAPTRTNVEGPTPPSRDPSGITTPHTPVVKAHRHRKKHRFRRRRQPHPCSVLCPCKTNSPPRICSHLKSHLHQPHLHQLPRLPTAVICFLRPRVFSSSSSTYRSAVDSPASDSASRTLPSPAVAPTSGTEPSQTQVISTPPPVPAKSGPTSSVSQQSIASTSQSHRRDAPPRAP